MNDQPLGGFARKGGVNPTASQVTERPPLPAPMRSIKVDTADPRIFISVEQMVDGQLVKVDREISLALWLDGRVNQLGRVLVSEVSAMMVEIGRGRP